MTPVTHAGFRTLLVRTGTYGGCMSEKAVDRMLLYVAAIPGVVAVIVGYMYVVGTARLYGQTRGADLDFVQVMRTIPLEQVLGQGAGASVGAVILVAITAFGMAFFTPDASDPPSEGRIEAETPRCMSRSRSRCFGLSLPPAQAASSAPCDCGGHRPVDPAELSVAADAIHPAVPDRGDRCTSDVRARRCLHPPGPVAICSR